MNLEKIYGKLIAKAVQDNGRPVKLSAKKKGFDIHHIKPAAFFIGGRKSKKANEISNLVYLTYREHYVAHMLLAKIHGGAMWLPFNIMKEKLSYYNARFYEKARSEAVLWLKQNEKWKENLTKAARLRAQDPEWIAMMAVLRKDPAYESQRVAGMKNAWLTEEGQSRKSRNREILEDLRKTPEWISAQKKGCEKRNADPEYQAKMRLKNQKQHKDPLYREKLFNASRKALSVKVVRVDPKSGERKIYDSMTAATTEGYCFKKISRACKKGYRHKGFLWEKLDTTEAIG